MTIFLDSFLFFPFCLAYRSAHGNMVVICKHVSLQKKYTWFISMHIRHRSGRLPFWFILSELTTSQKISAAPHFTVKSHAYKKWGELSLVVPKSEGIGTFKIWIGLECNLLQKPLFYRSGRYRLQKDTYFKKWSILNKCQKCIKQINGIIFLM